MAEVKDLALSIRDLGFKYPGQVKHVLENFLLDVGIGDRFGLFGPNGAGKTTLLYLITGLLDYQIGSIRLFGEEVHTNKQKIKKLIGFVPQDFSFYQELTPIENMEFFGALGGLNRKNSHERADELLSILGLSDVRNKEVGKFSGGMKRRVNLAIGVIHQPRILFLDEPTVGVDVQTRFAIIDYLKRLNEQGMTLVYTSHQLTEAQSLCNKIALVDEGKILVHGRLDTLLADHHQDKLEGLFLNLTGKDYRDSDV